jgi:hypothetical protein
MGRASAVPVKVAGVFEVETREAGRSPFVLLEDGGGRRLSIYIGACEAAAIYLALQDTPLRRPFSHDLMNKVVSALEGKLKSVIVDDFSNDVYYAKLHIERGGETLEVDARPSDAIAFALRAGAPILVNEEIFAAVGPPFAGEPPGQTYPEEEDGFSA